MFICIRWFWVKSNKLTANLPFTKLQKRGLNVYAILIRFCLLSDKGGKICELLKFGSVCRLETWTWVFPYHFAKVVIWIENVKFFRFEVWKAIWFKSLKKLRSSDDLDFEWARFIKYTIKDSPRSHWFLFAVKKFDKGPRLPATVTPFWLTLSSFSKRRDSQHTCRLFLSWFRR
jgi:hypothetical protein